MLLEQSSHSGVSHLRADGSRDHISSRYHASPAFDVIPFPQAIYVVAEEVGTRAAMAQNISACGWHVDVYEDVHEFVNQASNEGIVLAHEAGTCGALAVCQALSRTGRWLPVIGYGDDIDAERIIAGMKAGAMDYLVGPASSEKIAAKLLECAEAAEPISQVRCRRLAARLAMTKLSAREREVLDLLAIGFSNKEMARKMGISPRTVEIHRMKVMGKIGATSCADAVRMRIDALDG